MRHKHYLDNSYAIEFLKLREHLRALSKAAHQWDARPFMVGDSEQDALPANFIVIAYSNPEPLSLGLPNTISFVIPLVCCRFPPNYEGGFYALFSRWNFVPLSRGLYLAEDGSLKRDSREDFNRWWQPLSQLWKPSAAAQFAGASSVTLCDSDSTIVETRHKVEVQLYLNALTREELLSALPR